MHTYKTFLKIALKNAPSVMMYFIIFMVICIMSSSQSEKSAEEMYEDSKIRFAVLNRDESDLGETIKDFLTEKNNYVELEDEEEAIRLALYYRSVYYIVVVPEGFENAIKNGEDMELMNYKVSDSSQGYYMDMQVESYMQTIKSYVAAG